MVDNVRVDEEIKEYLRMKMRERKECLSEPLCFHLECGYNTWTARNQGRARIGDSAQIQVCGQRGRNVTVALAISPTNLNGLVFHSTIIGGMKIQRFSDVLAQTRQNLDPGENIIFIYDGAPAHHSPTDPGQNIELKKLSP